MLNNIDVVIMILLCWTCLWSIRQVFDNLGKYARAIQLSVLLFAMSMALKVLERFEGNVASIGDVIRDSSLLLLSLLVIVFFKHRFNKL